MNTLKKFAAYGIITVACVVGSGVLGLAVVGLYEMISDGLWWMLSFFGVLVLLYVGMALLAWAFKTIKK